MTPVVTCAGVVTYDVIALVDRFPEPDGRMEAAGIMLTGGGPAANAAVVLARQGVPVAFVGAVGDDDAGHHALELLDAEGVDVAGVSIDASAGTQTSCVIVDSSRSSRSIVTTAAPALTNLSDAARERIGASAWVHTDHRGYGAVAKLLRSLPRRPRLSLDCGNAPVPDLDMSMIDLYVPTVSSLTAQYGTTNPDEAAARALADGPHAVVATDGPRGARAWWDDAGATYPASAPTPPVPGSLTAPAYATDTPVVSTLGAGDVFHGALLSALTRELDWAQVLAWANVTAGLSTRGRDGREGVPDAWEVTAAFTRQ